MEKSFVYYLFVIFKILNQIKKVQFDSAIGPCRLIKNDHIF